MDRYYETALTVTSQFYFCGLPVRLDSYSYCPFACEYCFAKQRGGNFKQPRLKLASARALERWLILADGRPREGESILVEFLRQKVPIHFGGMSDPFPPFEPQLKVTLSLLQVLQAFDYPVVVSTKSVLVGRTPYADLLGRMKHRIVQFSISGLSAERALKTEGNTPSPRARLRAMQDLANVGVPVFCRIQPFFPVAAGDAMALVEELPLAGCRHVAVEHLKLPLERSGWSATLLSEALAVDIREAYQAMGACKAGREWVLPSEIKLRALRPLIDAIRGFGMTFGAADNDLQHLSDSFCCCSGVDTIAGFGNFFRHHIGYAIRTSRGCGEIRYGTIANEWSPRMSPNRYLNSNVRKTCSRASAQTIDWYIRDKWNAPGTQNAPTSWFGVLATGRKDLDGDEIYAWDEKRQ